MVREFREQLRDRGRKFVPHPLVESVLRWFLDLHTHRAVGMAPCPISWSDLLAYFQLTGERPERWQLDGVFALDEAWLTYEPPKAPDGAPLVKATSENIKGMFAQFKEKPKTGERDSG